MALPLNPAKNKTYHCSQFSVHIRLLSHDCAQAASNGLLHPHVRSLFVSLSTLHSLSVSITIETLHHPAGSKLIIIQQHVGNAICNWICTLAMRTYECPFRDMHIHH